MGNDHAVPDGAVRESGARGSEQRVRLIEPSVHGTRRKKVIDQKLGLAYGFAGFCTGPILGGVLTVAASATVPLQALCSLRPAPLA